MQMETKLNNNIYSNELVDNGYMVFRVDHCINSSGGTRLDGGGVSISPFCCTLIPKTVMRKVGLDSV